MKKLITIILALIMTLFTAPQKGAVRPPVTAEITPQTAITISVEQVPDVSETTAKTAFVSEVEEPETQAKIKETTVIESEDVSKETDIFTKEKMPTVQEAMPEKYTEVTEGTITEPKEDTVECIDEGDQNLAEYKPQIGDQPNPFENDTPTKIDNRPVTGFNEEMPYRWTPDTVSGILEREDYIGNTVNCRYTRLSYKDK